MLLLHLTLAGVALVSAYLHLRGEEWAGTGGQIGQSINVTIVPSAGIPMPQPPAMDSPKFDPDNGMYKVAPQPKAPAPPEDAVPIPSPEKVKTKPQPQPVAPKKDKLFDNKTPTPPNVVDYGKGGRLKNFSRRQQFQSWRAILPPASARPVKVAETSPHASVGTFKPQSAASTPIGTVCPSIPGFAIPPHCTPRSPSPSIATAASKMSASLNPAAIFPGTMPACEPS